MLTQIRRFFGKAPTDDREQDRGAGHDVRVATCALLLEMGRIDKTFSDAELALVITALQDKYGLSREHIDDLIAEADRQLEESVDLWQFARLINANYSNAEKREIIEILWQIVYVDGRLDKYEDYLIHRLANLQRLSHTELIDAKLKVLYPERRNGSAP